VTLPAYITGDVAAALGIVLTALLSEDAAAVTAASLATGMILDTRLAFLSAFAGLWVGDIGVYSLARYGGSRLARLSRAEKWMSRIARSSENNQQSLSRFALGVSRFFPGTRLPAYIVAGVVRMPVLTFAGITALSAAIWTGLIFLAARGLSVHSLGIPVSPLVRLDSRNVLLPIGLSALALWLGLAAWKTWGVRLRQTFSLELRKWSRWEFWPAWLFYPPVALMCAWLAIRFRGLSLPTASNPGQRNGGIVGESKAEILRELMDAAPEFTAEAYRIEPGEPERRMEELQALCAQHDIRLPFVIKPDAAQRGAGFRKMQSWEDAARYLAQVQSPVILQRYVSGPEEAGIFYYRFPGEQEGHILSITRKKFPRIVGDGQRTVEELIRSDERAALIAGTYLSRLGARAAEVLPPGEPLRLVEAGNHCQGCIFKDGADLMSERLRTAIDRVAQGVPGFYIGRFDVRYTSDDELRQGRGFRVIELNGAASEATSIYDERNSLWSAYKTLYRQWQLVYAIGAANRRRGVQPAGALSVWRDWMRFRRQAECYPMAD
jgi:membrane protein DedA with SNARE-associated domain